MDKRYLSLFGFFCLILVVGSVFGAPVDQKPKISGASENEIEEDVNEIKDEVNLDKELDNLGLEYGRYLQEVVKALDEDPVFSKKLENITHEQIINGHVSRIIDQVDPEVRNRLDELKRIELDRLRKLAMKEHKLEEEMEQQNDEKNAGHLDHSNPHTFEAQDLQRLIMQATKDLDEVDKKRRRDFKQYEMEKELHYREALQNMTSEEKANAVKKHDEVKKKHQEHPKVHHPGSKQQFEEVWTEQDHMPRNEFDPKIFFQMHDINGDHFLDQEEVEALLSIEVKKLYNEKDPSYDHNEMLEEYHRMREHIYKEIDSNHDGLISKKEFLDYTKQEEFQKDEGWKGIEEAPVYTEEELRRYEHERRQLQEHYAKYGVYQLPAYQQGQMDYAGQPLYYQPHPNSIQGDHPQQQQVYVVNAPPEHVQQVQYQHVQLPPQNYQHQVQYQQQQAPNVGYQQRSPPPQLPAPQQQQQHHPNAQVPNVQQPQAQYGSPQQGQYQASGSQQQPPLNQQYQQHPSNQQFQQPPSNQQYQQPPSNQQYQQQHPSNQQFQQPPSNQQHQQQHPSNQQFQQPPSNQQYQQQHPSNQHPAASGQHPSSLPPQQQQAHVSNAQVNHRSN